jgi:hypothetical protein
VIRKPRILVEATWALFTPILDAWARDFDISLANLFGGIMGIQQRRAALER